MIKALKKQRKLVRKKDFNYSSGGYYFITICTKGKICWFGDIDDGEMKLSEIGNIAQSCWEEIVNHYPNCTLDEFIIMPNHVHGILSIEHEDGNVVGTRHALPLPHDLPMPHILSLQRRYQHIPNIIGSFKASVTRNTRRIYNNYDFSWQRSYHDRIIRNQKEYANIKNYIINNPQNWDNDVMNK